MSIDLRDHDVERRFQQALKGAGVPINRKTPRRRKELRATSILANRQHKVNGRVAAVQEDKKSVRNLLASFYYAKVGAVVPDFEFVDGMLYTAVRAISARINQNYDGWPSPELAQSFRTFLGKPIFVNHTNFDPDRARGRVVAARYIENGKDKYIETIMEVDALRFPKLAHEIRTGGLDSVSMGVEAGFTICSYCGNKATDVFDMCDHVKFYKGAHLPDPRTGESVLVYENCYKLGFFELSYVFEPADETAVVSQVIVAGKRMGGQFIQREGARPVDASKEVFVHYNRHAFNRQKRTGQPQADLWSIRQDDPQTKKHVRGYIDDLHLKNARLHVQPAGSQLYKDTFTDDRGEGDRTVHAGIFGTLDKGPAPEGMPMSILGYNPKHNSTFVHKDTGEPVHEADHIHVDPGGTVYGYKADGWGRSARRKKASDPREPVHPRLKKIWDHPDFQEWLQANPEHPSPINGWLEENPKHYFDAARRKKAVGNPSLRGVSTRELVRQLGPLSPDTDPSKQHLYDEMEHRFRENDPHALKWFHGSRKKAWGEVEAPEDIDTLREDDDDSPDDYEFVTPYRAPDEDMPFQNEIESPEELQTPDFDQTKRLDRNQEAEGLDDDRMVENVEEVGGPTGAPQQAQPIAARKTRRKAMGRTRTKRAAEDEDSRPPWLNDEGSEGGEEAPPAAPAEDDGGGEYEADEGGDDEDYGGDEEYDDDGGDEFGGDAGGVEGLVQNLQDTVDALSVELGVPDSDDVDEDEFGGGEEMPPLPAAPAGPPPQFASRRRQSTRRRAAEEDEKDDDEDSDDDKPPWLKEKESRRRSPQRPVNGRSPQKKGRKGTQKGAQTVGTPRLAERGKVAAASRAGRANNRRVADDSGHTDGGPYGRNDLGEQAETFIPSVYGEGDGVPPAEGVAAPTGDESKAPNSETNLVARIEAKRKSLERDVALYEKMQRQAAGVEQPSVTNPELSGTDDQSLRGDDFQDVGLSSEETQPKDASRHWFSQFNNWLTQVTGRSWNTHSSGTLTRAAARWSKDSGVPLDALFPTLQTALRQAGKGEARRSSMNRYAEDEKLEVAAPDERVDVEKPVSNETDADAQASQFDLGDFGGNAGDNLADPEMSVDSQIWAPGEGEAAARSGSLHKKAEGMLAVRCAEAYIRANLVPPSAKWKIASWLQTQPEVIVADRANMLDAVYQANARAFAAARQPAGRTRGAATGEIPPGFGSGRRVASTARESLMDPKFDAAMWI